MTIKSKFNIGDAIYFPSVDLRTATIYKDIIKQIIITEENEDKSIDIVYQTSVAYGIPAIDAFKTAGPAKKRLTKRIVEKRDEVLKEIKEISKKVNDSKPSELVHDVTAQYEETIQTTEE